jgi:Kef-type K+ transport system membrane component KefB/nucleotide-binding universal stress UspA family protein
MEADLTTAQFVAELILLLLFGRLIGEGMNRIGQPAIFGQLLAGVLLGPSIFGAMAPDLRHLVMPNTPALKAMIDAISQIGILLLLLMTGMETNLALVSRRKRAVISTSLSGIAIPFACGVALAFALPADLIPSKGGQLVTALFLGTAMSISSVKIVAMVLMEIGAIRRDLGQLILATAILDDTIAWVLIAVISGIAAHGAVDLSSVAASVVGALSFLAVSLTIGRRVVSEVIRWTNDNFTIEVPVITAILLVMLSMALTTELIGVHTALGAFVAGLLIGQSPILTEHIEGELRGFILAFFSPVFFAVAGLGMDLSTLANPTLIWFTIAIILVASVGKFLGALVGGRIGGLTTREALALATGLNARGSTEVIIASIGLSMGALNQQLYTMIVAMAVITTMAMPPMLRWMLARVPMREDEHKRLEKEDAEQSQAVPKMERALVYVDESPNATMATHLAGAFAASQQVMSTVMRAMPVDTVDTETPDFAHGAVVAIADKVLERVAAAETDGKSAEARPRIKSGELIQAKAMDAPDAIEKELGKGYSIVFAGLDAPFPEASSRFEPRLQAVVDDFEGPVAFTMNGRRFHAADGRPLNILVPTAGAPHARLATEVALALARATGGKLTVFHVFDPSEDTNLLRGRARRFGMSILVDARVLGKRSGVQVEALTATESRPEVALRRVVANGHYDLVIIGAVFRVGDKKFIGPRSTALVRAVNGPLLLIAQ